MTDNSPEVRGFVQILDYKGETLVCTLTDVLHPKIQLYGDDGVGRIYILKEVKAFYTDSVKYHIGYYTQPTDASHINTPIGARHFAEGFRV